MSISRSRSPSEEPVGTLNDMNDCYSRLKELVPSIPQNKSVSQIEILQHVIDYIFDLQIALESPTGTPDMLMALKVSFHPTSSTLPLFLHPSSCDDPDMQNLMNIHCVCVCVFHFLFKQSSEIKHSLSKENDGALCH